MENEIITNENTVVDQVIDIPVVDEPVCSDPCPVEPTDDTIVPPAPSCEPVCTEPTISIGNFFGTLQEVITISWRYHLKTRKHHIHVALKDFYYGALSIVDDIIEQYQGINGVIEEPYINTLCDDGKTESEYLGALKSFIETNKHILGDYSEINSTIDNLLGLIDSTIYKITSFNEHLVKTFDEFCYENLNEGCCGEHCGEKNEEEEETFEDIEKEEEE